MVILKARKSKQIPSDKEHWKHSLIISQLTVKQITQSYISISTLTAPKRLCICIFPLIVNAWTKSSRCQGAAVCMNIECVFCSRAFDITHTHNEWKKWLPHLHNRPTATPKPPTHKTWNCKRFIYHISHVSCARNHSHIRADIIRNPHGLPWPNR